MDLETLHEVETALGELRSLADILAFAVDPTCNATPEAQSVWQVAELLHAKAKHAEELLGATSRPPF